MTRGNADVIVVGAGPAGSSAASFLAANGHRVLLLDKRHFPREKSCGDGVTRPGVRLLDELGVLESLADAQRYDGLRVHMRDHGVRDFHAGVALDPERQPDRGLVVPRLRLDDLICKAAAERGAELCEGWEATDLLYSDGRVSGVRASHEGTSRDLRASFVVCADGATSGLGRKAGLLASPREAMGYAIRGYYSGLSELPGMLEFYVPITDPDEQYLLPSYGWIFPTGNGEANVGIGLSFRAHGANVRHLFERFLARGRATEARFDQIEALGDLRGAPLRSDFTPERCAAPGILMVGDAAGLVSPFTGEGISYGLESGKLAAEAIHRGIAFGDDDATVAEAYVSTLRRRYGGYFETGRETTQRYELVFRILEHTFDDDRTLFTLWRRAALMPEGVGGLRSSDLLDDIGDLVEPLTVRLRADLAAVDEAMVRTVHRDWPFLSRIGASVERDLLVPPRPATLLLMCGYLGQPDGRDLIEMAVAAELSFFAALSHEGLDVEDKSPAASGDQEVHLGNVFAVLVGNFQLAKAFQLTTRISSEALTLVVASVAGLCEGRVRQLRRTHDPNMSIAEYTDIAASTSGLTFETICGLGSWLAGLDGSHEAALREYGRAFGVAYGFSEEIVSVGGGQSAVGASAAEELLRGRVVLPILMALGDEALGPILRGLLAKPDKDRAAVDSALSAVASSAAMEAAFRIVEQHARAARKAAERLPAGPARDSLQELTEYPIRRAAAQLPATGGVAARAIPTATVVGRDGVWSLPQQLGVSDDLHRLRAVLGGWREDADPALHELVEYQMSGPAKYFRPSTIFACHRAVTDRPPSDEVVRAAAALELFHNYTLVIDDVVDRDSLRRGKPALHRRFGRVRGIATGAYLAFGAARLVADDPETCRVFDELGKRIVVAECRQWRLRRHAIGVEDWRDIAGEDTGVMFEACARIAEPHRSLDRFGYLLGTLYHGCDDVADVRGAAALGGGRDKDITDRILTLPAALGVRDSETARLFEDGGSEVNEELAARFAALLPEAEGVLDNLASEAQQEALMRARRPEPLLALVSYTRALSKA